MQVFDAHKNPDQASAFKCIQYSDFLNVLAKALRKLVVCLAQFPKISKPSFKFINPSFQDFIKN